MKSPDIQRRLLLGAVGALALRPPRTAQADTRFTNFSFAATGAPALRTLPDRLSEVVNVKDWGAVGNRINNDTPKIQAAIDYCININRGGKIFFPSGIYLVSNLAIGSNSVDCGVQLIGSGQNSTKIVSTAAGFIASGGGRTFDCLEHISDLSFSNTNNSPSGSIQLTRDNASVLNCNVDGYYAIDASNCKGARIECIGSAPSIGRGIDSSEATYHGFNPTGTIAIQLGDNGFMAGCRAHAFGIAYTIKGTGASCFGCAAEVNNIGIRLGWSSAGASTAYACSVDGFQSERTCIPLEMYDCEGCYITGVNNQGADNPPEWAAINSVSWSGVTNKVTVNTTNPHNIVDSPGIIGLNIDAPWRPNSNGWVLVTVTGPSQFQYSLTSNPGGAPATKQWKYIQQYSLRIRKARECVISGITGSHSPSMASIDLDYGTVYPSSVFLSDSANAQIRNLVFENSHALFGWRIPVAKRNLGGCKFLHCSGVQNLDVAIATVASPEGQMTFADLPGQLNVFQPRLEGQTYNIKDGAKAGSPADAAAWGDQVQGGGSGHYLVRTDGTNWFRMG